MTDLPQTVSDDGDIRRYFTIIENMADDDLGVYEYRLLAHYKRKCGANGGQCTESVRTTAKKCQMSAGQVSKSRRILEDMGWVTSITHSHLSDEGNTVIDGISVTLINRMAENVERYSQTEQGCSPQKQGVHPVKQRRTSTKRTDQKTEPAASSGSTSKFGYTIGDHVYWVEEHQRTYRTTIHEVEIVRFTKAMVEVAYWNEGTQHTVLRKPSSLAKTPPKLERKTTPMQDAIGLHVHSVPVDAPIGKQFAIRLGEWEAEIMTVYPRITPEHLAAAFAWKGEFKPGKVDTVIKMLGEYRDHLASQNGSRPTKHITDAQSVRAALTGGAS